MKIVVYDSGVGGRSVHQLLQQHLTQNALSDVTLSYFADTKNYPYGTKTEEELKGIVFSNLEQFKREGHDHVVVACNTASSVIEKNPQKVPIATTTIIQPTIAAIKLQNPGKLFVIASNFTANNHVFLNALLLAKVHAQVSEQGEQTLINAIEADDQQRIQIEVSRIVSQLPDDAVFLWGCTHFSLIKGAIEREMQFQEKKNTIVDPANLLAQKVIQEHLK